MKLSSSSSLLILSLFSVVASTAGQSLDLFECSETGGQFYAGADLMNVTFQCCSDSEEIYATMPDLSAELEACGQIIADSLLSDLESNCNDDITECTIDFSKYTCLGEAIAKCPERVIGGHVQFVCDDLDITINALNNADCIANSCSDADVEAFYDAITLGTNPDLGGCNIETFMGAAADEFEASLKENDNPSGATLHGTSLLCVLVAIAGIFLSMALGG
jgi:hypothetical protein